MDSLVQWLEINGFTRNSTVHDTGDYAVRGGIIDLFAPALAEPIRLDFFGDTLESIRTFDPETQRTIGQLRGLDLVPMSEVQLTTESIKRFRQGYTSAFGGQTRGDILYEAISEGRRSPGLEHWLPLFYESLDTIFAYTGDAPLILDNQIREAASERLGQIEDYYEARKTAYESAPAHSSYKPLAPKALYLDEKEWLRRLDEKSFVQISTHAVPDGRGLVVDVGGRTGRSFAPERADESANVFEATAAHVRAMQDQGRHIIIAGWSDGSRERLAGRARRPWFEGHRNGVLAVARSALQAEKGGAGGLRSRSRIRGRRYRRHLRAGHSRRPARAKAQACQARAETS